MLKIPVVLCSEHAAVLVDIASEYRTILILSRQGGQITHPLGRFSSLGFLDKQGRRTEYAERCVMCNLLVEIFPKLQFLLCVPPLRHALEETGSEQFAPAGVLSYHPV